MTSMLVDLLSSLPFPHYCPDCRDNWSEGVGYVCAECWRKIDKSSKSNRLIGEEKWQVIVSYSYAGIVHDLVHQMKFLGRIDIAREFGRRGAQRNRRFLIDSNFDAVIPVPLHPVRVRERGYDQNMVIAREVAAEIDVELNTDLIVRKRNTPPQSRLSNKQRLSNLHDAIVPVSDCVSSLKLKVLIVDDVIHTGTTIMSCMNALAACGQDNAIGMAICG